MTRRQQADPVVDTENAALAMRRAHELWRQFAVSTKHRSLPETRWALDDLMRSFGTIEGVSVRPAEFGGISAVELTPTGEDPRATIMWLHGGAYCMGSPYGYEHFAARIAIRAHARVVVPDYRLAPEHHFPAAVDDACAAYRGLRESTDPDREVFVGGDSAGGGLAVTALLRLRELGEKLPAACVLASPWLDHSLSGATITINAERDLLISEAMLAGASRAYLVDADTASPLVAPLRADLSGLPPLLIQVGADEVLLDDSRQLATVAEAYGIAVALQVEPDAPHVYQLFSAFLPQARAALDRIGAFIATVMAHAGHAATEGTSR